MKKNVQVRYVYYHCSGCNGHKLDREVHATGENEPQIVENAKEMIRGWYPGHEVIFEVCIVHEYGPFACEQP